MNNYFNIAVLTIRKSWGPVKLVCEFLIAIQPIILN